MRKLIVALTAAMALAVAVPAAHADEKAKPDATLSLTEGSVAAGIGFSWGKGTLTYQGKTYPVSVEGLSVGSVGITQATVAGKVFERHAERQRTRELAATCRLTVHRQCGGTTSKERTDATDEHG